MNWLELIERFGAPVFMLGVATYTLWRIHVRQVQRLEDENAALKKREDELQDKLFSFAERSADTASRLATSTTRALKENTATIRGMEKRHDGQDE